MKSISSGRGDNIRELAVFRKYAGNLRRSGL